MILFCRGRWQTDLPRGEGDRGLVCLAGPIDTPKHRPGVARSHGELVDDGVVGVLRGGQRHQGIDLQRPAGPGRRAHRGQTGAARAGRRGRNAAGVDRRGRRAARPTGRGGGRTSHPLGGIRPGSRQADGRRPQRDGRSPVAVRGGPGSVGSGERLSPEQRLRGDGRSPQVGGISKQVVLRVLSGACPPRPAPYRVGQGNGSFSTVADRCRRRSEDVHRSAHAGITSGDDQVTGARRRVRLASMAAEARGARPYCPTSSISEEGPGFGAEPRYFLGWTRAGAGFPGHP